MVGGVLGDLLTSYQLDVGHIHAEPKYPQRDSHQIGIFCFVVHLDLCKKSDIHGTPHRFWL